MSNRFPVVPLLGALIHLVRHESQTSEAQAALLAGIRDALRDQPDEAPVPLRLTARRESLELDGTPIPLQAPGATLLHDQMLLHGIVAFELTPATAGNDLLRLAVVLAAFPATYPSPDEVLGALGASAERLAVTTGAEELMVRSEEPASPLGEAAEPARPALGSMLQRGRQAIEREDWEGLLDAALELADAESEAPTDRAGRVYGMELERLISRDELQVIARLAHGDRRRQAIELLRRFGSAATETLVELLVAATSVGERRGYYTAITQMNEGAEAIIARLDHPLWYVVRNAAELSADMELVNAVPALGRQIQHSDERVRKSVAGALARLGTPLAQEWLRKMLSDGSPVVRRQALLQLGSRHKGLCRAIDERLRQEQDPEVRREGFLALGRIGSKEAITLLDGWAAPGGSRLEGRKPLELRLLAVRGLALAGPAAGNELQSLTRDEVPEIRIAAAEALKRRERGAAS